MGNARIISETSEPFADRIQAGRLLAEQLADLSGHCPVVLGIPRGGVVIAREVADALGGQMDIVLTRKLGAPYNPELAIGAVTETGELFFDEDLAARVTADQAYLQTEKKRVMGEIQRRSELYRSVRAKVPLGERIVVVTDDGVATGATMKAALWAVRQENPKELICALPVGPLSTLDELAEFSDRLICLRAPIDFAAIGQFYQDFRQLEDQELVDMLRQESARRAA